MEQTTFFDQTPMTMGKTLAEKALEDISEIISNQIHNAMLEVGKYLIEIFYDDDYEAARAKKTREQEALSTLSKLIKTNNNSVMKSYSKSWLYNAVQYACDEETFKSFHTYGKLSQSQKILLFPINDIDLKKELIEEIAENNYTIKQLRERLAGLRKTSQTPKIAFTSMGTTELMNMKISDLKKYQKRAQKKITAAETEMKLYMNSLQTITMAIDSKIDSAATITV